LDPYLSFKSSCASHGVIGGVVGLRYVGVRAGRRWQVVDGEGAFAAQVAGEGEPPAEDGADAVAVAGEEADGDASYGFGP